MRPIETNFAAAILAVLTASTGAMAQSYYDDQACRQYANQQVAALQGQANAQAFGSTLLGAGLGAAIGGAVGGGRGAGIGAASGGVLGQSVCQHAAGRSGTDNHVIRLHDYSLPVAPAQAGAQRLPLA